MVCRNDTPYFCLLSLNPAFYCRYNKIQHYPLQLKRKGVNLQV